jgi:hypothetical protein
MLEFSVDGREAGEALKFASPRAVSVKAKAWSPHPLTTLELVCNGRVVGEGKLADDRLSASLDQSLLCDTTGWLAVRASGPLPKNDVVSMENLRGIAAHMNPIYVEIQGRPLMAKADAEYFLAWIDRLEKHARARDRVPTDWDHVQRQLDAAREVYRRIAREGAGLSSSR